MKVTLVKLKENIKCTRHTKCISRSIQSEAIVVTTTSLAHIKLSKSATLESDAGMRKYSKSTVLKVISKLKLILAI